MDLHALQSGYQLHEYRIDKLIGEGGFGLTYLAFDTNLDKTVAIKEYMPSDHAVRQDQTTIVPKSISSKSMYEWGLKAFVDEAKTLAKFDFINIVRVLRFFEENGTAYLVMEFCDGGALSERVVVADSTDADKTKFVMRESQVRKLMTALVGGLEKVHQAQILHRDIKPHNIMFRQDGTPVLIDFGAARQALSEKSQSLTSILTPGYAPIEQYSSKGKLGPWSDIYALAAVAYFCLTGKKPTDATDRVVEDDIEWLGDSGHHSAFTKSIDWALAVKASDRPKSLSEWVASWDEQIADEQQSNEEHQVGQDEVVDKQDDAEDKKPSGYKVLIPAIAVVLCMVGGYAFYVNKENNNLEPVRTEQPPVNVEKKPDTTPVTLPASENVITAEQKSDKIAKRIQDSLNETNKTAQQPKEIENNSNEEVEDNPNEEVAVVDKPSVYVYQQHKKQPSQTIAQISRYYDVFIADLKLLNAVETPSDLENINQLTVAGKVTIPFVAGATLFSISQSYGITVAKLKLLNPDFDESTSFDKKVTIVDIAEKLKPITRIPTKSERLDEVKLMVSAINVYEWSLRTGDVLYANERLSQLIDNKLEVSKGVMTVAQINILISDINHYLRNEAGYLVATAFLPEQLIKQGVVNINLLFGRLNQVVVANVIEYGDNDFSSYFEHLIGKTVEKVDLEAIVLELEKNFGIYIEAMFSPSESRVGFADLMLFIKSGADISEEVYRNRTMFDNRDPVIKLPVH